MLGSLKAGSQRLRRGVVIVTQLRTGLKLSERILIFLLADDPLGVDCKTLVREDLCLLLESIP